ncbi:MAG: hypothetical protein QNL18_02035, partial [Pseudomonadales bacterium]
SPLIQPEAAASVVVLSVLLELSAAGAAAIGSAGRAELDDPPPQETKRAVMIKNDTRSILASINFRVRTKPLSNCMLPTPLDLIFLSFPALSLDAVF